MPTTLAFSLTTTLFVVGFGILAIVLFKADKMYKNREWDSGVLTAYLAIAAIAFFVASFTTAPYMGYGRVPDEAEALVARLEKGVVHELIFAGTEGPDGTVVVVREMSDGGKVFALRVEEVPPLHFALLANGGLAGLYSWPTAAANTDPGAKGGPDDPVVQKMFEDLNADPEEPTAEEVFDAKKMLGPETSPK